MNRRIQIASKSYIPSDAGYPYLWSIVFCWCHTAGCGDVPLFKSFKLVYDFLSRIQL